VNVALLDARIPLYREVATIEVSTDDRTVAQIATLIVSQAGLA
jgi:shikimate kinase